MFYRIVFAIGASILPVVITYWLKERYVEKLRKLKLQNSEPDKNYYHCIFWTIQNSACREHFLKGVECEETYCSVKNLQTILKLLASSKYSISLCVYLVTLKQVSHELVKAQKRGVNVRLITDAITLRMEHSKLKQLKEEGFDVRTPSDGESYMHHKYGLIDAEDLNLQKVFIGSLNLTVQGNVANFEFVVITNNSQIIKSYSDEFESLWESFKT